MYHWFVVHRAGLVASSSVLPTDEEYSGTLLIAFVCSVWTAGWPTVWGKVTRWELVMDGETLFCLSSSSFGSGLESSRDWKA